MSSWRRSAGSRARLTSCFAGPGPYRRYLCAALVDFFASIPRTHQGRRFEIIGICRCANPDARRSMCRGGLERQSVGPRKRPFRYHSETGPSQRGLRSRRIAGNHDQEKTQMLEEYDKFMKPYDCRVTTWKSRRRVERQMYFGLWALIAQRHSIS
jgi:hypothetical protein